MQNTETSNMTINWDGSVKKIHDNRTKCPRVASGIQEILYNYLNDLGINGDWQITADYQTSSVQNRISYLRTHNGKFEFKTRPFDRDSGWVVSICLIGEPLYQEKELQEAFQSNRKIALVQEENTLQQEHIHRHLVKNRKFTVKIINFVEYGVTVEIVGYDTTGTITWNYLTDIFDKNIKEVRDIAIKNYRIGDTFNATIINDAKGIIQLSKTSESAVSEDIFSWQPDSTGELSLKGYSYGKDSTSRLYEMLGWIAFLAIDNPLVPRSQAIEYVTSELLKKSPGATHIPPQAVGKVIKALVDRYWISTHRNGDIITHYEVTEDGWNETGMKCQIQSAKSIEEPIADIETIWSEPIEEIEPEPETKPIISEFDKPANVDQIHEYFVKFARLLSITKEMDNLIKEKEEIKNWINTHQELKNSSIEFLKEDNHDFKTN